MVELYVKIAIKKRIIMEEKSVQRKMKSHKCISWIKSGNNWICSNPKCGVIKDKQMTPCKKCSQWRKNGNQWICIRCGKETQKADLLETYLLRQKEDLKFGIKSPRQGQFNR